MRGGPWSEQQEADQPKQDQRGQQTQNHFFGFRDGKRHSEIKDRRGQGGKQFLQPVVRAIIPTKGDCWRYE